MKWLQNAIGLGSANSSPAPSPEKQASAAAANEAAAPGEAVEDEVEDTEKWAVPDEISGETTPPPIVDPGARSNKGRSPSGRRLARTVASPIPAMLAESMGLAEEPSPPNSQNVSGPPTAPSTRR